MSHPWSFSNRRTYDYFRLFFTRAPRAYRAIMGGFFLAFLIVPLLGGPEDSSATQLESGTVFIVLNISFYLTALIILLFNRTLDEDMRRTGQTIALLIVLPITAFLLLTTSTVLLGNEFDDAIRASASTVVIVPLLLVISLLIESVLRRGRGRSSPKVPLVLVFLTIFLVMYTFATIYFVNGLLVDNSGDPIMFGDSFYFSGQIFTTLGSGIIGPAGAAEGIVLFESISGYMVLGLLTAVFIQTLMGSRTEELS